MGTAVSLDIRTDAVSGAIVDAVFAWLREVDERFSPWKPGSEVSRLIRAQIGVDDVSADLREVLLLCDEVRALSGGAFDIRAHRSDGRPDPTGLVKGWAVQRASLLLDGAGVGAYCLNAGGDVIVRGSPEPGRPWLVGIRHPLVGDRVAAVVRGTDLAVATSGSYERGHHIVDGRTGQPALELLSVTVVGPSMTLADACATAAFAMGREGLRWVAGMGDYSACGITADERLLWTPGFGEYLVRDAPLDAP